VAGVVRATRWGLAVLAVVGALLAPGPPSESASPPRRLAILVASAWKDDTSAHADVTATYQVLRRRGFAPEELMVLSGPLTRSALLAFLHDVRRRLASWDAGEVWLSYSGHGFYEGKTAADARPGLLLTGEPLPPGPEQQIFWDEVFAALQVPAAVPLTVLPDS
jgi:hypothetical protein